MQLTYFDEPLAGEIENEDYHGRVAVVSDLEAGEPVFVVRARDAGAITFLALYEATSARLFGEDRAATLGELVDAFVAWRREHAALVRDPD